ncbi:MAG: DNA topoisomerase VI subunit B [Myxococcales bacterium]|nr:DNA topoisomerase VI subunit B [Myxococcales bacterium]
MTTDGTDLNATSEGGSKRRATAEAMAAKQRDISVSEFFTKNRHLLGFDNPQKALLTSVKEAVDNSLDACEEAGILPTLKVTIEEVSEGRFRVTVEDNGPGIVKAQIPKIFAKLLYGSKFHRLKQSRGQQGIGISAAGMYGQLTTGRPIIITSKIGKGRPAYRMAVRIDARTNAPEVLDEQVVPWEQEHGTIVSIEMSGNYRGGRASVASYLEQTVVANPHLELTYVPPKGEPTHFPRASEQLPTETVEIKPHPYGVELGMLIKSFQEAGDRTARQVLMDDYSRVTEPVAAELLKKAEVDVDARASRLDGPAIEAIHRVIQVSQASVPPANKLLKLLSKREDKFVTAIQELGKNLTPALVDDLCRRAGFEPQTLAKKVEMTNLERFTTALESKQVRILPPPATCVAPIGESLIVEGLKRRFKGEFFASHTRPPAVYRGNPFVVEVGIAYGGELAKDEGAEVLRFANRVPLLYQPRACATTEAVVRINWKAYAKDGGINQRGAELPVGPLAVFVHLASVWVPFTNEAKEAIASYDEIIDEIRVALMECGRKLATYLNSQVADKLQRERKSLFEKYIEEIAIAIGEITSMGPERVRGDFLNAMAGFVHLDEPAPKSESLPPPAGDSGEGEGAPAAVVAAPEPKVESKIKSVSEAKPAEAAKPESKPAAEARPAAAAVETATTKSKLPPTVPAESPANSGGEWPARATASATSATPAAPSASEPRPSSKSWLEAELEARIAAKKIGAVSKESPEPKAPESKPTPPAKSAPLSTPKVAPTPVAKSAAPVAVAKSAPAPVTVAKNAPVSVAKSAPVAVAKSAPVAAKSAPTPVAVAKSAPSAKSAAPVAVAKSAPVASAKKPAEPARPATMRAGKTVVPATLASAVRASGATKSTASVKAPVASAKRGADKKKAPEPKRAVAKSARPAATPSKKKSGSSKGSAPRRGRR